MPLYCDVCKYKSTSTNVARIKRHILSIHGYRKIPCPECETKFADLRILREHERKMHLNPAFCDVCHRKSKNNYNLIAHFRTIHVKIPTYDCDSCFGKFKRIKHLIKHSITHTPNASGRNVYCDLCKKTFNQLNDLKRHIMINHEIRIGADQQSKKNSFQCHLCESKYSHPRSLQSHVTALHSDAELKFCNQCNYRAMIFPNLLKHLARVHAGNLPDTVRIMFCNICGKSIRSRQKMTIHLQRFHKELWRN